MKDTEPNQVIDPIKEGDMNFITFKNLVEEVIGEPFDKVYKDWVDQGIVNEQSNLE